MPICGFGSRRTELAGQIPFILRGTAVTGFLARRPEQDSRPPSKRSTHNPGKMELAFNDASFCPEGPVIYRLMIGDFSVARLQHKCPGVSIDMIRHVLKRQRARRGGVYAAAAISDADTIEALIAEDPSQA